MKSTARDFWKMVTDRKCRVIVMLSGLVEGGEVRITATLSSTRECLLVFPGGMLPVLAQQWHTKVWRVQSGCPGGGEAAGLCTQDSKY